MSQGRGRRTDRWEGEKGGLPQEEEERGDRGIPRVTRLRLLPHAGSPHCFAQMSADGAWLFFGHGGGAGGRYSAPQVVGALRQEASGF